MHSNRYYTVREVVRAIFYFTAFFAVLLLMLTIRWMVYQ